VCVTGEEGGLRVCADRKGGEEEIADWKGGEEVETADWLSNKKLMK
jgi:hypothetical protein